MSYTFYDGFLKVDNSTVIDKEQISKNIPLLQMIENKYGIQLVRPHVYKIILFDDGASGIYLLKKFSNIFSITPVYLGLYDYEEQINVIIRILLFILKSKSSNPNLINLCEYKLYLYLPKNLSVNLLNKFTDWVNNGIRTTDIFDFILNVHMFELEMCIRVNHAFELVPYQSGISKLKKDESIQTETAPVISSVQPQPQPQPQAQQLPTYTSNFTYPQITPTTTAAPTTTPAPATTSQSPFTSPFNFPTTTQNTSPFNYSTNFNFGKN